jgi:predicted hotdog family 3-hydroxylacyl-ACP dehydratase
VSRFDPNLVATMLLMLMATAVAAYGAQRVTESRGELRRSSID